MPLEDDSLQSAIDLVLSHATQSDRDIELRLRRASGRHFEGQIEVGSIPPPSGRWYLKLEPGYASDGIGDRAIWRLSGSVWLPLEEPIRLGGDT